MVGEVNYAGNIGTGVTAGAALGGPVGAAVGALGGLALSGIEYAQNKKQAAKDVANRPQYVIPPEVKQGLTLSEQQALVGLPEAQKQQYLQNLNQGAAYSLGQQQTRKGGLAGLAAINQNLNQGYGNLLSADAQARMQKQQQVFGQLQNQADYKGQAFQLNQLNPYYENMARNQANRGALYQNVSNSLQLGMYGLSGIGGQQNSQNQTLQGQSSAPLGTSTGYNTSGQPISVKPGVDGSQYVNMNTTPSYTTPQYAQLPPYKG
jgi:hypothetical protein